MSSYNDAAGSRKGILANKCQSEASAGNFLNASIQVPPVEHQENLRNMNKVPSLFCPPHQFKLRKQSKH
ncbi:hypothetical protein TIFTF001_024941 [Ficus carica]|uniref:Uncharacterized protein n=1 Tax=Ficus carica TaxID=3494 RepID=A0AA88DKG6_FICCA|nr:hypothetical protein TIFTF001_024941 [Ficus carica]